MTTTEYEQYVESLCKDYCDLNYCIVALNGEAGEIAEWHKKFNLRRNPDGKLCVADLWYELGDVLFYLTRIAKLSGKTLEEIMKLNKFKLDERNQMGGTIS